MGRAMLHLMRRYGWVTTGMPDDSSCGRDDAPMLLDVQDSVEEVAPLNRDWSGCLDAAGHAGGGVREALVRVRVASGAEPSMKRRQSIR